MSSGTKGSTRSSRRNQWSRNDSEGEEDESSRIANGRSRRPTTESKSRRWRSTDDVSDDEDKKSSKRRMMTSTEDPPPDRKIRNNDYCETCGDGGDLLCCDACPCAFHFSCAEPPVDGDQLPEGDWFCRKCSYQREKHLKSLPKGPFASLFQMKTCGVCGADDAGSSMVFCGICKRYYHRWCLEPMAVNDATWVCPDFDSKHDKPTSLRKADSLKESTKRDQKFMDHHGSDGMYHLTWIPKYHESYEDSSSDSESDNPDEKDKDEFGLNGSRKMGHRHHHHKNSINIQNYDMESMKDETSSVAERALKNRRQAPSSQISSIIPYGKSSSKISIVASDQSSSSVPSSVVKPKLLRNGGEIIYGPIPVQKKSVSVSSSSSSSSSSSLSHNDRSISMSSLAHTMQHISSNVQRRAIARDPQMASAAKTADSLLHAPLSSSKSNHSHSLISTSSSPSSKQQTTTHGSIINMLDAPQYSQISPSLHYNTQMISWLKSTDSTKAMDWASTLVHQRSKMEGHHLKDMNEWIKLRLNNQNDSHFSGDDDTSKMGVERTLDSINAGVVLPTASHYMHQSIPNPELQAKYLVLEASGKARGIALGDPNFSDSQYSNPKSTVLPLVQKLLENYSKTAVSTQKQQVDWDHPMMEDFIKFLGFQRLEQILGFGLLPDVPQQQSPVYQNPDHIYGAHQPQQPRLKRIFVSHDGIAESHHRSGRSKSHHQDNDEVIDLEANDGFDDLTDTTPAAMNTGGIKLPERSSAGKRKSKEDHVNIGPNNKKTKTESLNDGIKQKNADPFTLLITSSDFAMLADKAAKSVNDKSSSSSSSTTTTTKQHASKSAADSNAMEISKASNAPTAASSSFKDSTNNTVVPQGSSSSQSTATTTTNSLKISIKFSASSSSSEQKTSSTTGDDNNTTFKSNSTSFKRQSTDTSSLELTPTILQQCRDISAHSILLGSHPQNPQIPIVIPFIKDESVIGRSTKLKSVVPLDAAIGDYFEAPKVSQLHAKLRAIKQNGSSDGSRTIFELECIGRNGTKINGELKGKPDIETVQLSDGDIIGFSTWECVFRTIPNA